MTNKKLIKIKIERIECGKALAREIYLHLPVNNKMIRIISIGDDLRPALLQRLQNRGVAFLFASSYSEGEEDPDTLQLYQEAVQNISVSAPTVSGAPERVEGNSSKAEAFVEADGTISEKQNSKTGAKSIEEETTQPAPAGEVVELRSRKIASKALDEESTNSFNDAGALSESESNKIAADNEEEAATIVSGDDALSDPSSQKITADNEEEATTIVAGDASTNSKSKKIKAFTEEENTTIVSGDGALPNSKPKKIIGQKEEEASTIVRGDGPPANPNFKKIKGLIEEEPETLSFNDDASPVSVPDAFRKGEPVQSIAGDPNTESFQILKDARLELQTLKATEELVSIVREAENATGTKRDELLKKATHLKIAMDNVGAGLPIPAEFERRFPVEKEMAKISEAIALGKTEEALKNITLKTETLDPDREWAVKNLGNMKESTPKEASAAPIYHREIPQIAARLASYLAHSLGYVNQNYLSDLALGAILYFSRKAGKDLSYSNIPEFTQAILRRDLSDQDATLADSIEIIDILEIYFQNPDCNKNLKDFSSRVFVSALTELNLQNKNVSAWNQVRWSQFVEKGPSILAESLCARAAAKATRASRQLSS
jgi:hypothetical protein